jgi:hypothetical protein
MDQELYLVFIHQNFARENQTEDLQHYLMFRAER